MGPMRIRDAKRDVVKLIRDRSEDYKNSIFTH